MLMRRDGQDDAGPAPALGPLRWLRRLVAHQPLLVGEAVLALLLAQSLALVPALAFSIVIDKVIGNHATATLIVIGAALAVAAAGEWAFGGLRRRLQSELRRRVAELDDGVLFDAVLRLSGRHARGCPAATAERLERAITVRDAAVDALEAVLVAPAMLVVIFALMAHLDTPMAAVVGLATIAHGALLVGTRAGLAEAGRAARAATELGRAAVADIAAGASAIRGLGAEPVMRAAWLDAARDARARGAALEALRGALAGAAMFKTRVVFVLVLAIGAFAVDAGTLTVGGFVAFSMLLRQFSVVFEGSVPQWQRLAELRGWVDRIDAASGRAPAARAATMLGFEPRGALSLSRIGFGYDREPDLLSALDVEIRAGELVAVAGPAGCGKSTLLGLMSGTLAPRRGVVALDGHDLASLAPDEARRCLRLVGQEPHLFRGTVLDNLRLGAPGADFGRVEHAARLARAHDLILRLPGQYATTLDDRRRLLSPGERMRLCLARALVARPAVLLLDEPDRGFGAGEEGEFLAALAEIRAGRTVVLATSSPALLARVDRIVAIRAGRAAVAPRAA